MDPILEDELKRFRTIKLQKQYQDYFESTQKSDSFGTYQGKKVKRVDSIDSLESELFKKQVR